jgi:DNA-directed RNA polymerase specialized sigma24 family protein
MDKSSKEVADVFSSYTNDQVSELVLRMRGYAKQRLGDYRDNHEGQQKLDFVFNVFQKALTDLRKWDKNKCDFENFLFGVLKSEISAYHEKEKRRKPPEEENGADESYILNIPVYSEEVGYKDQSFDEIDNKKLKENYVTLLKDSGASDLEMLIFECWCEDIYKPSEIADFLEVDITEVYNAVKRLERRKSKLNSQVK